MKALLIARMVLLNFHPDNQRGQQHLLAILFDMNNLWERFILAELQAHSPADWELTGQSQHGFWEGGTEAKAIRPDLVFRHKGGRVVVMDTKWKLPEGLVPSSADLYQLFAYNRTMGAARGFLLYPNKENKPVAGHYVDAGTGRCDVLGLCLQAGGLGKDAAEWIWAHVDESLGDLPPTTREQG